MRKSSKRNNKNSQRVIKRTPAQTIKQATFPVLSLFIFTFIFEWLAHGKLLTHLYQETRELWRPENEIGEYFSFKVMSQFFYILVFFFIASKLYKGKDLTEGAYYGFYIGLFSGIVQFSAYALIPISLTLAAIWLSLALIQGTGMGIVLTLARRK